jgi:hypothetical protein
MRGCRGGEGEGAASFGIFWGGHWVFVSYEGRKGRLKGGMTYWLGGFVTGREGCDLSSLGIAFDCAFDRVLRVEELAERRHCTVLWARTSPREEVIICKA